MRVIKVLDSHCKHMQYSIHLSSLSIYLASMSLSLPTVHCPCQQRDIATFKENEAHQPVSCNLGLPDFVACRRVSEAVLQYSA